MGSWYQHLGRFLVRVLVLHDLVVVVDVLVTGGKQSQEFDKIYSICKHKQVVFSVPKERGKVQGNCHDEQMN